VSGVADVADQLPLRDLRADANNRPLQMKVFRLQPAAVFDVDKVARRR
jgi:hypothetical protein